MFAHTSPVTSVDAARGVIFSGSYDGTVIAWDHDLRAMWRFCAEDLVNDLRVSPDGAHVAVASADGYLYVLQRETGRVVRRCGRHGDDVNAVAWHPDGDLIAAVTDALSPDVLVWAWREDRVVVKLSGHRHGAFAVEFSPDGRRIVTAAEDRTCRVWSSTGDQLACLEHPADPETSCWTTSGLIASGCEDGLVRLWDATSGRLVRSARIGSAAVRLVQRAQAGGVLLVGTYDGAIHVVTEDALDDVEVLRAPFQWERAAVRDLDGNIVVASFGDRPVVHRPAPSARARAVQPTFGVNDVSVSVELRVACLDSGRVIDVDTGSVVTTHASIVNTAVIAPPRTSPSDARVVFSGDYHGHVRRSVRPVDEGSWSMVAERVIPGGPVNSLALGSAHLVAANYAGRVHLLEPENLDEVRSFVAHGGPVKSVAVDGELIFSGSADDSLACYTVAGDRVFLVRDPRIVLINSVAVADRAGVVVTGSRQGRVAFWDARTGSVVDILPDLHAKSVKCVAVDRDASMVVSTSYDGDAYVWWRGTSDGWEAVPLRHHSGPGVPTCALSAGKVLLGGWDGTVTEWTTNGNLLCSTSMVQLAELAR